MLMKSEAAQGHKGNGEALVQGASALSPAAPAAPASWPASSGKLPARRQQQQQQVPCTIQKGEVSLRAPGRGPYGFTGRGSFFLGISVGAGFLLLSGGSRRGSGGGRSARPRAGTPWPCLLQRKESGGKKRQPKKKKELPSSNGFNLLLFLEHLLGNSGILPSCPARGGVTSREGGERDEEEWVWVGDSLPALHKGEEEKGSSRCMGGGGGTTFYSFPYHFFDREGGAKVMEIPGARHKRCKCLWLLPPPTHTHSSRRPFPSPKSLSQGREKEGDPRLALKYCTVRACEGERIWGLFLAP